MYPKLESDVENFFKLEGIIELKNDRTKSDKVELQQKYFGENTTHKMESQFDIEMIDEK